MKWRSIKDDPPRPSVDPHTSWYLVRSEKGVPQLAIMDRRGLTLWDSEDPYPGDAMFDYDEWLEVSP